MTHDLPEPTVSAAVIAPLFAYALSHGLSTSEVEAETGISPSVLMVPDNRIPEAQTGKLWEAIGRAAPGKAVGIDFVRGAPMASIAALAYSARYASTVRQIFDLIIRNQAYASEGNELRIEESGDGAAFIVSHMLGAPLRQAEICVLGICHRTLREVLELDIPIRAVEIVGPPAGDPEEYARFFGAPVTFDAPRCAMMIDRAALDIPSKFWNAELAAFTEAFFAMALRLDGGRARHAQFDRLLDAVARNVSRGRFAARLIARDAGWSMRTAQRVAAVSGTTLGALVRDARFSRIEQLMRDRHVSLAEVAFFAGYSDDRAFRRAFKAKYGVSPSVYRRRLF